MDRDEDNNKTDMQKIKHHYKYRKRRVNVTTRRVLNVCVSLCAPELGRGIEVGETSVPV